MNFESRENNIELEIAFGVEKEIERVAYTVKKLPWYREQGYGESNSRLPKNINEQSSAEEIADAVSVEFSDEKYADFSEYVQEQWPEVSKSLEVLRDIPDFKMLDTYTITLTRYGTGGSYDSRNGEVIVNIEFRSKEKIMETVVHEIIHIGVQHLISKYDVRHWYKERLVDLIGNRYFPDLRKMQNIKEDISVVDKTFEELFSDIEAIARVIGGEK